MIDTALRANIIARVLAGEALETILAANKISIFEARDDAEFREAYKVAHDQRQKEQQDANP